MSNEFEGGRRSSNYGEGRFSKLQHHVQSDLLYGYAPNVELFRAQTQAQDRVRVQSWHSVGGSEKSVSSIKGALGTMRKEEQKRNQLCQRFILVGTVFGVGVSSALIVVPLVSLFAH